MDRETFEAAAKDLARAHGYVTVPLLAKKLGLDAKDAKRRLQTMYDGGALELDLEDDDFVYRLKGEVRPRALPERAGGETPSPEASVAEERRAIARRAPVSGRQRKAPAAAEVADEDDGGAAGSLGDGLKEATAAMMARGKTAVAHAAVGALMDDAGAERVPVEQKKSLLWGLGLGMLLPGIGLFYAAPMVTASLCTAVVLLTLGLLQLIPVLGTLISYFLFGFFMLTSGALGAAYTYYFNKTGRRTRLRKGGKGLRALPF